MDRPVNRFRRGLESGATQYGFWLGIPDPTAAEIAACAGFDWLLVDHEHAPFEVADILAHLRAIAPYDVAPIVRPVDDDPALLKKLLDIGVQSFLVPMVESAAQAQAIADAVRYPPEGKRGLGTSLARAARWNTVPRYVHEANAEICVIVQVETAAGMANLDAILDVDGIDGVFIGPSDLSASMGHVGNAAHPDVAAAIENGFRRIIAAGRYAGILCLDPDQVAVYRDLGVHFIGVGVDTLVLSNGARKLAESFKA